MSELTFYSNEKWIPFLNFLTEIQIYIHVNTKDCESVEKFKKLHILRIVDVDGLFQMIRMLDPQHVIY